MKCADCELLLAQREYNAAVEGHLHECRECRILEQYLGQNGLALNALRNEELPRMVVRIPRPRRYVWLAAAAAAGFLVAMLIPVARPPTPEHTPPPAQANHPLRIKMLTSDPDVVIYWLVDSQEGE